MTLTIFPDAEEQKLCAVCAEQVRDLNINDLDMGSDWSWGLDTCQSCGVERTVFTIPTEDSDWSTDLPTTYEDLAHDLIVERPDGPYYVGPLPLAQIALVESYGTSLVFTTSDETCTVAEHAPLAGEAPDDSNLEQWGDGATWEEAWRYFAGTDFDKYARDLRLVLEATADRSVFAVASTPGHEPIIPTAGGVAPWCTCGWRDSHRMGPILAEHIAWQRHKVGIVGTRSEARIVTAVEGNETRAALLDLTRPLTKAEDRAW